jgi:hypothetical protein
MHLFVFRGIRLSLIEPSIFGYMYGSEFHVYLNFIIRAFYFPPNRLFINEMNDILGGKPNHGLSVARKVVLVWVTLTRFLFFMLQAVTEIVPSSLNGELFMSISTHSRATILHVG